MSRLVLFRLYRHGYFRSKNSKYTFTVPKTCLGFCLTDRLARADSLGDRVLSIFFSRFIEKYDYDLKKKKNVFSAKPADARGYFAVLHKRCGTARRFFLFGYYVYILFKYHVVFLFFCSQKFTVRP